MKTFYLESLGCSKNLVDSERFAAILHRAGWKRVGETEGADLVLVNSCSFLSISKQELADVLGGLVYEKEKGRIGRIMVTGCVMERGQSVFREVFPEVDFWLGLKDFAWLERWLGLKSKGNYPRLPFQPVWYRYLRIADGCSNHCSYCTIPSIRGELRSTPIEELVAEAELLTKTLPGPPVELTLIAQDTSSYGLDLYGRQALPELLERLHAIPQFKWIRLLYLHPDHFVLDWLELWKRLPKLLPYFEIPIQHSEDRILRAMNRRKGREELKELFSTIIAELPEAVLRTTVIAGFPGETAAEASALGRFLESFPFLHVGAFQYSQEDGTRAAALASQIAESVAKRRFNTIMQNQYDRLPGMLENYVGKTVSILVEESNLLGGDGLLLGRAWIQAPEIDGFTFIDGQRLQAGRLYDAVIRDVIGTDLFAEVVSAQEQK